MFRQKMTGKERVYRQLKQVVPSVETELDDGLRKNAEEVANLARSYAPKKTGKYAASIQAKRVEQNEQRSKLVFKTKSPKVKIPRWGIFANYIWRYIEHGTASGQRGKRVGSRATDVKRHKALGRKSYRTHPGTPPHPHLFPAWRVMVRRVRGRTSRVINKAVKNGLKK